MKIDQVSKKSGLSKRTIRYYEEIGLLPVTIRSKGGYRLYTMNHLDYLNRIIVAKDVLGLTLQEVQNFLSLKEEIENQRAQYKKEIDPQKRKEKLMYILKVTNDQLNMINKKLQNMNEVKLDVLHFKERVNNLLKEIDD